MEDVLSRARVFRALVELRGREPEAMTAGELGNATSYDFTALDRLRKDLVAWGLITIEKTHRGRLPVDLHRLTPEGREVADLCAKIEAVALKAREKAKRRA